LVDGLPIWLPSFNDNRTLAFYGGSTGPVGSFRFHQVKTDGTGLHEISVPPPIEGARVVPQFRVAGSRWQIVLVLFPDEPAVNPEIAPFVREVFLTDGKEFVQVTDFDRANTALENTAGFPHRGRVFFLALPHRTTADADDTQRVETTGPFAYPPNFR
jgi:hypothetical protein